MKYRCINNPAGYCLSKPEVPEDVQVYHYPGPDGQPAADLFQHGTCIHDWRKCPQYLTWQQERQRMGLIIE